MYGCGEQLARHITLFNVQFVTLILRINIKGLNN